MDRRSLVPVIAVAIINGIFSPWVLMVFVLYPVWYPSWLPPLTQIVHFMSALILSTLTLMASGVPAALYERMAPQPRATFVAAIWFVTAILLSLPAVPNVTRALAMH